MGTEEIIIKPVPLQQVVDAAYEAGKMTGREEVVEWVKTNEHPAFFDSIHFDRDDWETQKKEWGVE